jgi:hypothetical protein
MSLWMQQLTGNFLALLLQVMELQFKVVYIAKTFLFFVHTQRVKSLRVDFEVYAAIFMCGRKHL